MRQALSRILIVFPTMNAEATLSFETSADFQQTKGRYIPEDKTLTTYKEYLSGKGNSKIRHTENELSLIITDQIVSRSKIYGVDSLKVLVIIVSSHSIPGSLFILVNPF
jgi:hypothetical protein